MAVRNFWLEAMVDGRRTMLSGGPVSKDGGLSVVIKQRDKGGIVTAATIDAYADTDGTLTLRVFDADGKRVLRKETTR